MSFVKRILLASILVACASVLSGCWNGRLLIAMDQTAWAAEDGDTLLHRPLVWTSLAHGYIPGFLLIQPQEDPVASLMKALKTRHYQAVVLGPVLFPYQGDMFPAGTRALVMNDQAVFQQGGVARLEFDRTAAFRTAGLAAGLSISHDAGGTVTNALASRIGVLISARPPGTASDLTAFTEGVAQALDGGQPSVRSISAPVDRIAVKAAIDQMRKDGVEVFLLFMGAPDGWALEDLKDTGGSAVVSNWAASGAFPRQVFLSIEMDFVGGVSLFLAGRQGMVSGPVRIVAGQGRTIPAQVMPLVTPR